MRAKLELAFQNDVYRVWVWMPGPTVQQLVLEPALEHAGAEFTLTPRWRDVDPTAGDPPPSFIIPAPALEAIVDELEHHAPSGAGRDAIEDARGTRDRLLELVEHVVKPEPPA